MTLIKRWYEVPKQTSCYTPIDWSVPTSTDDRKITHEVYLFDYGIGSSDEIWCYQYSSIQHIVDGEVTSEQRFNSRKEALRALGCD